MMIHYISPYDPDKNMGRALNLQISRVTWLTRDWIVHTDQDVMFLRPETKKLIYDILLGTQYDVLGCLTNRVGIPEQCATGRLDDNTNILDHYELAGSIADRFGDTVKPATGDIAGFFLAFRPGVWVVNRFEEKSIVWDRQFVRAARKSGYMIGIMQGVYVWHTYRLWSSDPQNAVKHLV